jgi:uncharacterized membrane protein
LDYVQYRFLIWNLFLAWLPLVVSMLTLLFMRIGMGKLKLVILLLCGLTWLLLYPNAPYLTTDFIHLIFDPSYGRYDRGRLLPWYDLVMFFLFSWCGLLLGYLSMRQFHAIVYHYFKSVIGWVFIFIVSFLGGFGVYLGRVIRLNSWDVVFNPFRLIESVLAGINAYAAIFTFLFGMLILIVYLSLYLLSSNRRTAAKKEVLRRS